MATALPATPPNQFQNRSGNIALSLLDANFTDIYQTVNGIGSGTVSLANVQISGGNAVMTTINAATANITNLISTNVTVSNVSLTNISVTSGSLNNVVIGNVTPANGTFTNVSTGNLVATGGSLNNIVVGNVTPANGSFVYVTANGNIAPTVNIGAISYGNLTYTDNNNWQVMTANVNSYAQVILQNYNTSNQASTDFVLSNDQGTSTTNYINLGINGSNYAVSGSNSPFNSANAGYVFTSNANLVLGSTSTSGYVIVSPNQQPMINIQSSGGNFSGQITSTAGTHIISAPYGNTVQGLTIQLETGTGAGLGHLGFIGTATSNALGIYAGNRISIGAGYNYANSIPQGVIEAIGIDSQGANVTINGKGNDGNVPFTVYGVSRFSGTSSDVVFHYYGNSTSTYLYVGPTGSRRYEWRCNSVLGLSISDAGNVGIGPISPANTIFHWGNASAGAVTQTIQNNTANATITLNLSNLTITSPGITTISSTGNVIVQGANTTVSAVGALTINTSGNITFTNATANTVSLSNTSLLLVVGAQGALGYGTGAGGNVTQATSKATGVTLNAGSGRITMNNASLASNTTVTFLLTNNVISATDNMIVSVVSGAVTVGSYTTQVSTIAAGSANISVRNITAGALSEAIVLAFTVLKGATA